VAHAWMPGARRIRAGNDGGPLKGGAPRVVWLTLGTAPRQVSIQSAAGRLVSEQRPCHLVWDPATGEIAQLISALRAGRALGAPEHLGWRGRCEFVAEVNNEGRICLQIGVLAQPAEPFTNGPMAGIGAIIGWLDSWGIPRRWPAGKPGHSQPRDRALWARGGHFGASQVPDCESTGPGDIDIDRLTGSHLHQVRAMMTPSALPISA
jgi:hypothetical protein